MGINLPVLKLVKYKLSLAVTLSAAAGYYLYPDHNQRDILYLIGGIFCLSGGSAALNQVQEWRRDALMGRTRNRPIPAGKISPFTGLITALAFITGGSLILSETGILPVALGLLTVALYNGIYTPLKPRTSFAVLPGGLVGALPPVIGWTAAGGSLSHPNILFVATLMFLWQMPHFWLLLIRYGKEYELAGFSTLRRKLDDSQIKRLVFWWIALSLVFLLTAPLFGIGLPGWLYITLGVMNVLLIGVFYLILFRTNSDKMLRLVFILTNVFLTLVLLALILASLVF